jgi:hypothetical protein
VVEVEPAHIKFGYLVVLKLLASTALLTFRLELLLDSLVQSKKSSKKGKSRNVYPGFDKSLPEVKGKAELAIKEAVKLVERNIDRISK